MGFQVSLLIVATLLIKKIFRKDRKFFLKNIKRR